METAWFLNKLFPSAVYSLPELPLLFVISDFAMAEIYDHAEIQDSL